MMSQRLKTSKAIDTISYQLWSCKINKYYSANKLYKKIKEFQEWNFDEFYNYLKLIVRIEQSANEFRNTESNQLEGTQVMAPMLDVLKKNGVDYYKLSDRRRMQMDKEKKMRKINKILQFKKKTTIGKTWNYISNNSLISGLFIFLLTIYVSEFNKMNHWISDFVYSFRKWFYLML